MGKTSGMTNTKKILLFLTLILMTLAVLVTPPPIGAHAVDAGLLAITIYRVNFHVTDINNNPISDVTISLDATTTLTDSLGDALIRHLNPAGKLVSFSKDGYVSLTTAVSVSEPFNVSIQLETDGANRAPSLKPGVPAAKTASVEIGTSFSIDLAAVFEDADGDPLSYQVSHSGAFVPVTGTVYSFTPTTTGTVSIVFKANDGRLDSISHTLLLNVTDSSAPYVFPFTDVPDDAWYRPDLETANKSGLISGRTHATFVPGDNITFAETVVLAARMHQFYHTGIITLKNGEAPIPWYAPYYEYAVENEIIGSGMEQMAEKIITRLDFINIFYLAIPNSEYTVYSSITDGAIPDVPYITSSEINMRIYTLYRAGILTGYGTDGRFRPYTNITRDEVSVLLSRMFYREARVYIKLS